MNKKVYYKEYDGTKYRIETTWYAGKQDDVIVDIVNDDKDYLKYFELPRDLDNG